MYCGSASASSLCHVVMAKLWIQFEALPIKLLLEAEVHYFSDQSYAKKKKKSTVYNTKISKCFQVLIYYLSIY